jgi:biopolymer transport protein ExbD
MLDMAFQLLAFFILTFQAPSSETAINLRLPIASAALPAQSRQGVPLSRPPEEAVLPLRLRAVADEQGGLKSLRLGDTELVDPQRLPELLQRASEDASAISLTIVADDALKYKLVALILSLCSQVELDQIRLSDPELPDDASP